MVIFLGWKIIGWGVECEFEDYFDWFKCVREFYKDEKCLVIGIDIVLVVDFVF